MNGTAITTLRRRLFVINCMTILPRVTGGGRGLPRRAPPVTCALLVRDKTEPGRPIGGGGGKGGRKTRGRRGEDEGKRGAVSIYIRVPTLLLFFVTRVAGLENKNK